jgi:diacylglycerol O-acyltransferase
MATAKLSHRLTTQDASFLYGESESTPLHFSGLATFKGSIYFAKLCIYMERRLPLLPRFRQRLVFAPLNLAHPALEDDPDFQLDNHLFHHQLPEGSNDAALHGKFYVDQAFKELALAAKKQLGPKSVSIEVAAHQEAA